MPLIVSIVGKSKSGKTALIEKLVGELKSRGYRVVTIKHTPKGMTFDEVDKDSWRHIRAGSEATAIVSSDKIVFVKPMAQEFPLDQIARFFGEDYDIILAEGFRQSDVPKIEVHRKEVGPPFSNIKKLIAIVTDEPLETKTRQFSLQDIKGLADLLEEGFIKPQRERVSLCINNAVVALSTFPKEVITSVILAMASCLKGVGEVRSLELFLRRCSEK